MRILHVIAGLNQGGAERVLANLVIGLSRKNVRSEIASLTDIGPVGMELLGKGFNVEALGMARGYFGFRGFRKLIKFVQNMNPDVIQTWMYHADLVGGVVGKVTRKPVVWNIRNSTLDPLQSKRSTIVTMKVCAHLSRTLSARVIVCAESACKLHADLGYDAKRMIIVPNGVDTSRFRHDCISAMQLRKELAIPTCHTIVGHVARFDPQKNHIDLLNAASSIVAKNRNVTFVFCGQGVDIGNRILMRWAEERGITSNVRFLGIRQDLERLYSLFDIACMCSSYGEASPNAVLEAMASGVPCVVTDVGDAAEIVAESGLVVPIANVTSLTSAIEHLIGGGADYRRRMGERGRLRIERYYSAERMLDSYYDVYHEQVYGASAFVR